MSSNSRSGLWLLALAAIIGLLSFCGYLLYQNNDLQKLTEQQSLQIDESEKLKVQLDKQYYQSLAELEEMRGNNDELNALIEKQKEELKGKKNQIYRLLKTKNDLEAAKSEMLVMREQLNQYVAELNTLKQENSELRTKTVQLEEDKQSLQTDLTSKVKENQELETVRATLVSEKQTLTEKAADLGRKVDIASAVKVAEINVTSYKIKNNGKAVERKSAKSVERLELCFDALSNRVIPAGEETFFIRIIDPKGETLSVEELGSGILTEKINNQQIRFTQSTIIDYENDQANACAKWEPNIGFSSGNYQIEVYNKGYLAGVGSFSLK